MLDMISGLRAALRHRCDSAPSFGWYLRTDPQVTVASGGAEALGATYDAIVAKLHVLGDYFGVHMHPLRWSAAHGLWVHDFSDRRWLRECTHESLDVFERWSGSPVKLFRAGAGFLNEDIVDVLDQRNVAIEMSLEPVAGWGLTAKVVPNGTDDSPIVGSFLNCASAPCRPYHPSTRRFSA